MRAWTWWTLATAGLSALACSDFGQSAPGPEVVVFTRYPGASPAEVEQGVLLPLEAAVSGVPGVVRVRSTGSEGRGTVRVSFAPGVDPWEARGRLTPELVRTDTLPQDVEPPILMPRSDGEMLLRVVPRARAEEILQRLRATPGVSDVLAVGIPSTSLIVEIDPQRLAALRVPLTAVLSAPTDLNATDRLIRTVETVEQVGERMLTPEVRLRDLAQISVAPPEASVSWNGEPAVLLRVWDLDHGARDLFDGDLEGQRLSLERSVELVAPADLHQLAERVAGVSSGPKVLEVEKHVARVWFLDAPRPTRAELMDVVGPGVELRLPTPHQAEVALRGPRDASLPRETLLALASTLSAQDTVVDAWTTPAGGPDLEVEIDRETAASLGITPTDISTPLRLLDGIENGDVTIRWTPSTSPGSLTVSAADGSQVPLSAVASVGFSAGPPSIERLDGRRIEVIDLALSSAGAGVELGDLALPVGWSAELVGN